MPAIWRNPSSRWRRDQGDRTGAGRHARKRAAERLGAVRNWVRTYREGGMAALRPENRNASQTNKPAPRRSRNARAVGDDVEALRRRVEELELENALMREVVEARRKRPRHRAAEHAVVHGPHGVFHPRGQGVPVARDRLLRRHAGRPDDRHQPGLGVGHRHARRRVLHAQGRRETNHPSRPWLPLPVARVDPHPQGQQPDAFDGRERLFSGQRRRGELLRPAQAGVLPQAQLRGRLEDGFINMLDDYMVRYRDKRIKTESGHGHHGPAAQTRSCGMIGGDGINDESNKTAPAPSDRHFLYILVPSIGNRGSSQAPSSSKPVSKLFDAPSTSFPKQKGPVENEIM